MSKRLEILIALTEHLKGISTANGYSVDVGDNVYRGRERFGAQHGKDLPFLSILEPKTPDYGVPANEEQTIRNDDWLLLVQGFCKDDPRNPTDPAYILAAAVEKRLGMIVAKGEKGDPLYPGVYHLGGKVAKLTIASPVVRPPEDALSDTAFFFLPIRIGMKVDLREP